MPKKPKHEITIRSAAAEYLTFVNNKDIKINKEFSKLKSTSFINY